MIHSTSEQESTGMRSREELLRNRNQNRSTVACQHGVVCTSQPLATLAGVDVLKAGGNAIDAALCANAMLSLVEPMSCGPGGDLFAILWIEKDQRLYALNASGRAPYDWTLKAAEALSLASIPAHSPLSWSVPGCVSGWASLHTRFGTRPFSELFAPVIRYATEGFPVSPIIAEDWGFQSEEFPSLAGPFLPGGQPPRFGDMFRNPDLAAFYELLVTEGPETFYKGSVAERIVRFSQASGGRFSLLDFQDHEATWVDPVCTNYRGYDVWEVPPNGQGISVLQILNMLESFDIASLEPNSAPHLHLFIEAKRLAYEDRALYYADMDFADVPLQWLTSKEYGKERARKIDPTQASTTVQAGIPEVSSDTIYLTTADGEGNMVSLIQSIYHAWGSRWVPDHLGFALQNRGMSFSLDPGHRNKLEPHKRPFHTILPAFVTRDGRPVFSFGVMGGDFQPQGHCQILMNMIDFGMSAQQAGDQPRVEHSGSSTPQGGVMRDRGVVRLEKNVSTSLRQALADLGHQVSELEDVFGGYQGIWREENPRRYFAGSDPRKDGCAIGY